MFVLGRVRGEGVRAKEVGEGGCGGEVAGAADEGVLDGAGVSGGQRVDGGGGVSGSGCLVCGREVSRKLAAWGDSTLESWECEGCGTRMEVDVTGPMPDGTWETGWRSWRWAKKGCLTVARWEAE